MAQTPEPEFSHVVDLTSSPRGEKTIRLSANEGERAKIAKRLGVPAVEKLEGEAALTASKAEITVSGAFTATLIRECVASLEEMREEIGEDFEAVFLRLADEDAVSSAGGGDDEIWDGEEVPPEVHEGDSFDAGEFLVQQLALAMDPFPRKPEAKSLADEYGSGGNLSPFAELGEKLKKSDENQ